jgi:hypothetical protein
MSDNTIKQTSLRAVVKFLLEDKSLGPAMIKVNPVVDQSAALTDPGNPDFKPTNKPELKAALSAIVADVPDEKIPNVYDSLKNAIDVAEDEGEEEIKMSNKKVEETIRLQIRKMISEIFVSEASPVLPRPKFMPPSSPLGPVDPDIVDTKGMSAAEKKAALGAAKWAKTSDADAAARAEFLKTKGVTAVDPGASAKPGAQKPSEKELAALRTNLEKSLLGAEDEKAVGGKKNLMGDEKLKQLATEFGYKNPNGVAQFINKILQDKVKQRLENPDAYEIATLEAMNDYISKMLELDLIEPQDAELMKQNPEFVGQVSMSGKQEDPEDEGSFFRTKFLAPRLKKLDKMFAKGSSGV